MTRHTDYQTLDCTSSFCQPAFKGRSNYKKACTPNPIPAITAPIHCKPPVEAAIAAEVVLVADAAVRELFEAVGVRVPETFVNALSQDPVRVICDVVERSGVGLMV